MDTRVGYPNEHLSNDVPDEMASPMYATGTGLVIEGFKRLSKEKDKEVAQGGKGKPKGKGKIKAGKEPKTKNFLSTIQDWFEKDQLED